MTTEQEHNNMKLKWNVVDSRTKKIVASFTVRSEAEAFSLAKEREDERPYPIQKEAWY